MPARLCKQDPETSVASHAAKPAMAVAFGRRLRPNPGEWRYLWRAVDYEGEVSESYVTKKPDTAAALKYLPKAMKGYGDPRVIATDKLKFCRAAMKLIGHKRRQETRRHLNNRAENSHLPFRGGRGPCLGSGGCEVCISSFQSIHQCTIILTSKAT